MSTKQDSNSPQRPEAGWTRRDVLTRSALAAAIWTAGACGDRESKSARVGDGATDPNERDVLVLVFLRGGMDGLSLCVPHAEDTLYKLRPKLAIPRPKQSGGAIDLDGFFGVAPAAKPLEDVYRSGHLAFVHATGLRHPTRSHFDAMKNMENGSASLAARTGRPGWLARALGESKPVGDGTLRAVAVSQFLPAALFGANEALAIPDPRAFTVLGKHVEDRRVLGSMYGRTAGSAKEVAQRTISALEMLERTRFDVRQPRVGAGYPDTDFGRKLALAAGWIRARIGIEMLTIDYGGWDHHGNLGATEGTMAQQMDDLSRGLSAFARDLDRDLDRVTLIAQSEFGRRVAENASAGLDHGHGGVMLVLGGHVAGGRVHGKWPTLAPEALDDGDVAITTDARDVLAEVLQKRVRCNALANVFPGHTPEFRGVVT